MCSVHCSRLTQKVMDGWKDGQRNNGEVIPQCQPAYAAGIKLCPAQGSNLQPSAWKIYRSTNYMHKHDNVLIYSVLLFGNFPSHVFKYMICFAIDICWIFNAMNVLLLIMHINLKVHTSIFIKYVVPNIDKYIILVVFFFFCHWLCHRCIYKYSVQQKVGYKKNKTDNAAFLFNPVCRNQWCNSTPS